jgi:hypothetical protein
VVELEQQLLAVAVQGVIEQLQDLQLPQVLLLQLQLEQVEQQVVTQHFRVLIQYLALLHPLVAVLELIMEAHQQLAVQGQVVLETAVQQQERQVIRLQHLLVKVITVVVVNFHLIEQVVAAAALEQLVAMVQAQHAVLVV